MVTAIVVAAGKSTRMGAGSDKAFMSLCGKPVVAWSLLALERSKAVDRIILVVRKEQILGATALAKTFGISKLMKVVAGGTRRQESVQAGLNECDADTTYVLVHDGARPLITPELVTAVVKDAQAGGPVTVGHKVIDTIKKVDKKEIVSTVSREDLYQVQTPQVFPVGVLKKAYKSAGKKEYTDDCMVVEKSGEKVRIFETNQPNLKITTVEDLQIAVALLK
jgi:2-C-methyl-D-erythritol 4-phosphate cytidylyltransferase